MLDKYIQKPFSGKFQPL